MREGGKPNIRRLKEEKGKGNLPRGKARHHSYGKGGEKKKLQHSRLKGGGEVSDWGGGEFRLHRAEKKEKGERKETIFMISVSKGKESSGGKGRKKGASSI